MSELTIGQEIVCSNHLTNWADHLTFDQILTVIIIGENCDEAFVDIWEPFCEWKVIDLIQHMAHIAHRIDYAIEQTKKVNK